MCTAPSSTEILEVNSSTMRSAEPHMNGGHESHAFSIQLPATTRPNALPGHPNHVTTAKCCTGRCIRSRIGTRVCHAGPPAHPRNALQSSSKLCLPRLVRAVSNNSHRKTSAVSQGVQEVRPLRYNLPWRQPWGLPAVQYTISAHTVSVHPLHCIGWIEATGTTRPLSHGQTAKRSNDQTS